MEVGTTFTILTARLPILNPGEYDLWLMRIEQYFLMTDYSLWEVILNGNKVLKRTVGEVEQEYEPTSAEEKQDRRNEMKARGTLLMALPNKDQLKFHSYKDAKLLMEAIEKRYGGNKESKKVQRTLLKQQYENFAGSSSETMDQTFDRLQKLISQLEIQGEVITQEDINLKLLRSLPSEWKTHALIWRNKEEIETISLDDLYNNLKIYEPELTGSTNTSQNSQNVAFVSSNNTNSNNNSSTNEADNTTYGVSAAHTQSNPTSGDNLSDAVICAFLASQPNSPQLAREDLEQIDPDDLEEMDLQWEMAMLTIRARRFIKRTGRKLDVNGQRVRFDRSKVECYNCHKNGHFARECRAPRNQENRGRKHSRRTVTVETLTENTLVAQDGIGGYDWSYQAEEEHPTNYALMAYTSSGSSSSSDSEVDSCSKSCVKAYATLKEQYDSLSSDYKKSQFNLVSYKAGLESVEARLAHYKKNEVVFEESINVLNLEVKLRDNALVKNKKKLEKAGKEREMRYNPASSTAASPAVESFVSSSEMLENQECNKSKSDKGYHAVPPPYTGNFIPFKPDLMFMDEIVEIEPKTVKKNTFRPPVIKHMTGNKCYLTEYEDYDGGFISFGDGKGRISGKVLSSNFKLLERQVLLRVPRKDNIYSVDLKSVVPTKGLTCLFDKAIINESNLWHRRLGHINFKNMNKLVRGNLVRGLMHKRFQMSSMEELTFFLGLQVQQKEDEIFISQDKYVAKILKKFDFATVKTTSTPMKPNKALVKDEEADSVDVHLYISMIGSLIYLKGQPKLGLWYPRDSSFDLEAFLDSDYAGASLDRKSTTGVDYTQVLFGLNLEGKYDDQVFKDGFDECIGLKMLFGPILRVKHGKKFVSAARLALCYWAKTEENVDFHKILDFLTSSSINFALTVSPTLYASYIEQFWNTACLKTIISEKQIHANVDGKAVVVSES
ncbi:ribonuclease H-like domain-containing protein [Tanacetum coccineum]